MPEYRRIYSSILFTIQITFFPFFPPFSLEHIFNWDVNDVKFWLNTWMLFFVPDDVNSKHWTQSDTTESKSKCLNILILSENVPILMTASRIYAKPDNINVNEKRRKKKNNNFSQKKKWACFDVTIWTMMHVILFLIKINANKCCLNGWWNVSVHLKFDLLGKGVPFNECLEVWIHFNVLR